MQSYNFEITEKAKSFEITESVKFRNHKLCAFFRNLILEQSFFEIWLYLYLLQDPLLHKCSKMSQPPQYYFSNPQQQQQQYQQLSHFHQQPIIRQPQYLMMQQHQIIPQQQPQAMSQLNTQHVSRQAQPRWFDRMC